MSTRLWGLLLVSLFMPLSLFAQTVDTTPPLPPGVPISLATITNANVITWEWSAATDPESLISDYQIDIGLVPSGSELASRVSTNGQTRYTLTELQDSLTYYAQVRAVNSVGLISPPVSDKEGVLIDQQAPKFTTDLTLVSHGAQIATVRWETNELARATVRSWIEGTSAVNVTSIETYQQIGSVTLNNLCPGTAYRAVAEINDQAANQILSRELQFETLPGEPCSQVSQETTNQATIVEADQLTSAPSHAPSEGAGIPLVFAVDSSLPSPASSSSSFSIPVIASQMTANQFQWAIGLSLILVTALVLVFRKKMVK